MTTPLPPPTKERILDAAERLFAEHGIDGTSLRAITSEAEANLAAVNYHFGSKHDLVAAVLARRVGPLNEARLRRLEEAEARSGGGTVPLEVIVEAFVRPALEMRRDLGEEGRSFLRFAGRFYFEPDEEFDGLLREHLAPMARRFAAAFSRALPWLEFPEVLWRMHFLVGCLMHVIADPTRVHRLAGQPPASAQGGPDLEELVARLIDFGCAGLSAPAPSGAASPSTRLRGEGETS